MPGLGIGFDCNCKYAFWSTHLIKLKTCLRLNKCQLCGPKSSESPNRQRLRSLSFFFAPFFFLFIEFVSVSL